MTFAYQGWRCKENRIVLVGALRIAEKIACDHQAGVNWGRIRDSEGMKSAIARHRDPACSPSLRPQREARIARAD